MVFGLQLEIWNFYLLNNGVLTIFSEYFADPGYGVVFKSDPIHRLDTFPGQLAQSQILVLFSHRKHRKFVQTKICSN